MSSYADRLAALREQLKAEKLDGFVVPLTDEHMSEYVGSYAQRLAWLTGFQGSAGSAVVLPEEAAIFVDGRYTLQVRQQVSADRVELPVGARDEHHRNGSRSMRPKARASATIPWLHTSDWVKKAKEALASRGAELVAGRPQPDRRNLDRPARSVEGASGRPARPICRQVGGREAHRDRRLAGQAPCRRGGAVGARFDRLGVQHPRRRRRPTRRSRWLMRSSTPTAPPICSSPRRRSAPDVRQHLGNGVRLHERSRVRERAGRAQGQDRRGRPRARGRGDLRGARQGRRQDPAAARPDDPAQGAQEPGRDRRPEGRAGRATARRSRASSTGSTRKRPRARSTSSSRPTISKRCAAKAPSFATCRSTASRAPGRTARSSITSRARRPTASSRRARST